ncbi:glutathione S-transferase family protein [Saccharibacter sp. 17.LH.SD]|uniref:glutathione S-transferase family protein n=1 Tax=Saccharibacter sp. 17.LH.SD TaxID=2689393 RepID=UPI00136FBC92|nr:glutathione S-transferase family protein [Saccharibacter sp. 17.LH.SD]MXV45321.1 glutathione S-transferase family protein [Saccharibacter sp. 17.LH.SD]
MGELVNGTWYANGFETTISGKGDFARRPSVFRNRLVPPGEEKNPGDFPAEKGRYHLYVSLACPWAHRTLIVRKLKGLEDLISVSVVHWLMDDQGWTFDDGPGVIPDTVNDCHFMREIYTLSDPHCTSRVTVPVLWDKKTKKIVSNESSDIIRMFNEAFDTLGAREGNYYPKELRTEIDQVNDRIYDNLNNGVYRSGFATSQEAYGKAVTDVFETLDWLEERLSTREYLVGDKLTEADIRLFTTLVRFDAVYHGHFKCNKRLLASYPALHAYTSKLYRHPSIHPTVDWRHIKNHYYQSHPWINPTRIVPLGPDPILL